MSKNDKDFEIKGRKIKGAKYEEAAAPEQKSAAEFLAAIDAVLAVKGVKAVHWTQYTPYFNDGDPCEFGINEFGVKLSKRFDVAEDAGDYEDGYVTTYDLFEYGLKWPDPPRGELLNPGDAWPRYGAPTEEQKEAYQAARKRTEESKVFMINGQDTSAIYEALKALNEQSTNFEFVAKANFGDHAEVTATKDGFTVEEYEHD